MEGASTLTVRRVGGPAVATAKPTRLELGERQDGRLVERRSADRHRVRDPHAVRERHPASAWHDFQDRRRIGENQRRRGTADSWKSGSRIVKHSRGDRCGPRRSLNGPADHDALATQWQTKASTADIPGKALTAPQCGHRALQMFLFAPRFHFPKPRPAVKGAELRTHRPPLRHSIPACVELSQ